MAGGEGYLDALEHVLSLYERLAARRRLGEGCLQCPLVREITRPQENAKAAKLERFEEEMGYSLR